ncbi:MAG: hypothetical protein IT304_05965 [Dehalococcoidia bacterium]|nr:hypothetical protein [Dehalococcoidia bacterium]
MAEMHSCAHCGVAITDESTMQQRNGQTFCCRNCAAAYERMNQEQGSRH